MNHAQVFAARFPNATDRTGWTQPNLALLIRDIGHRVTAEDFDCVCRDLLRSQRREAFPVPPYGEVIAAVDRFCTARATRTLDPAIERMRRYQQEYRPRTPEQRAAQRQWLDAFKANDKAGMAAANATLRQLANRGGAA